MNIIFPQVNLCLFGHVLFFFFLHLPFCSGLAAGIYTTNSAEACLHCAQNCEAGIFVVENEKQLEKVLQIKDEIPSLKAIIQYDGKVTAPGVISVSLDSLYLCQTFLCLVILLFCTMVKLVYNVSIVLI